MILVFQLYVEEAKSKQKRSLKAAKKRLIKRVFGNVKGHALTLIEENCIEEVNEEENFAQISVLYDSAKKRIHNNGIIDLARYI